MKKNILDFLKEKKEILLFIGVLMLLTGAILTINKLAVPKTTKPTISNSTTNSDPGVDVTIPEAEKMILPIVGDYNIVLEFFDLDNPNTMADAVINNGNTYFESKGISYAREDNKAFDVLAVFSGKVIDVKHDDLEKTIVTVEHEDGLVSKYYSLSNVNLKINDLVESGDVIGTASESLFNTSAGIHVHLEIIKDKEYLNPTKCFNKTIEDITGTVSK